MLIKYTFCFSASNTAECGYWCIAAGVKDTNSRPAKSFGRLPVGTADQLFDQAIVWGHCCVYTRTREPSVALHVNVHQGSSEHRLSRTQRREGGVITELKVLGKYQMDTQGHEEGVIYRLYMSSTFSRILLAKSILLIAPILYQFPVWMKRRSRQVFCPAGCAVRLHWSSRLNTFIST